MAVASTVDKICLCAGGVFLLLSLDLSGACAQTATRGQFEARALAGYATFIDESFQDHAVAGASAHYYVTRRFSVGPELLYLYRNAYDHDLTAAAQFAWDFRGNSRLQPYVAGHIGVLRQYEPRFTVNSWTWNAGIGIKIALTQRLYLVPDVRLGVEPLFRATIGVGYVLRR